MTKLPRITGRELVRTLKKAGFEVIRIRGSHHFLGHRDGRCTVVPIHGSETIGLGLLSKILNDIDLSNSDLIKLLKK